EIGERIAIGDIVQLDARVSIREIAQHMDVVRPRKSILTPVGMDLDRKLIAVSAKPEGLSSVRAALIEWT
ncbi:MAG TPA: hypothetical protein VGL13_05115, partial [Polyangiaceae bacterium]